MKKYIKSLEEFVNRETFIFLYDRIIYIEEQINQIQKIRELDFSLINILEKKGINTSNMRATYTESVYSAYRSMFQDAFWESGMKKCAISTEAYYFDCKQNKIHEEILNYIDKVQLHQDSNCGDIRGVYPVTLQIKGNEHFLTWKIIKYHVDSLLTHVDLMKKTIENVYFSKFNKKIYLFNENSKDAF